MGDTKPFIPNNKPKSWVIGTLAGLIGLLIGGPLLFLGAYFKITPIKALGYLVFVPCWAAFFLFLLVFFAGALRGKYKNIQPAEWKKQLW